MSSGKAQPGFSRDDAIESTSCASAFPVIENIRLTETIVERADFVIYKAWQMLAARIVAVKMASKPLSESSSEIDRFRSEARRTSQLQHPNIVAVYASGVNSEGRPYLVMEHVQGETLRSKLNRCGRLSLDEFEEVFLGLLAALDHAHRASVIHGKLRPENIFLTRSDSGASSAKLVDFGLSKFEHAWSLDSGRVSENNFIYLSGEQCGAGEFETSSDLYSLAYVMYESLSGSPPSSTDSVQELIKKLQAESCLLDKDLDRSAKLSHGLAAAIGWGLEPCPEERPSNALIFAERLERELSPFRNLQHVPPEAQKSRRRIIAFCLFGLFLGILLAFSIFKAREELVQKELRAANRQGARSQSSQILKFQRCFESFKQRSQTAASFRELASELEQFSEVGSSPSLSFAVYLARGNAWLGAGNARAALSAYEKALSCIELERGYCLESAHCYACMAIAACNSGAKDRLKIAASYARKALDIADSGAKPSPLLVGLSDEIKTELLVLNDYGKYVEAQMILGSYYGSEKSGEYDLSKSTYFYRKAKASMEKKGGILWCGMPIFYLSSTLWKCGHRQEALSQIEELERELAGLEAADVMVLPAWYYTGLFYRNLGDLKKTEQVWSKGVALSHRCGLQGTFAGILLEKEFALLREKRHCLSSASARNKKHNEPSPEMARCAGSFRLGD